MSAPAVIAGWGLGMAAIGAVGVLFFGFDGPEPPALFGGVALAMVLLGLALWLSRLGESLHRRVEVSGDVSPASLWLGVSLVLLAASAELGLWLTWIAGGMTGVGVAALIAERREEERR